MTLIGNLSDEVQLRFTKQGKAVASFKVITSRNQKSEQGEWESVDVTGWSVQCFDQMAENVAESLTKGTPVIVYGRASWRSWQKDDGTKGGRLEITAHHVGVDLKRRTAKVNAPQRQQAPQTPQQPGSNLQPDDPWATAGQAPF